MRTMSPAKAICGFMAMMYNYSGDQFIKAFEDAFVDYYGSVSKNASLYVNDEEISSRKIEAREMAEHLWNKYYHYDYCVSRWYGDLDGDNRAIVAIMTENYLAANPNSICSKY